MTLENFNTYIPKKLTDIWLEENDKIIIFSDDSLNLKNYELSGIAAYIWQLCNDELNNIEIVKKIQNIIDENLSFDVILNDTNDFLNELKELQLINWKNLEEVDILLVCPPYPSLYSEKAIKTPEYSAPPLGLAYIASTLIQEGFTVKIVDLHITASKVEDVINFIRIFKPKIIGVTSTTPTFPNADKIIRLAKAFDEKIVTIMGGVHVTSLPEETLKANKFCDFIGIGEGEQIMTGLANFVLRNNIALNSIKGLAYLDSEGKVVYNSSILKPKNLDYIPIPARNLLAMDKYYQKGSIISTRGCPFDCTYCACPLVTGREFRKHTIDYVLDEMELMNKIYGIEYFDFHDDTFNIIPARIREFKDKIHERNLNFKWGCFCRATNFDYSLAKDMKDAGCDVIQFGVESGNQFVLDSVRKRAKLKDVEDSVSAAKKAGIKQIVCGFIIGHSSDTEESANETIEFGLKLAKLGATRLAISILTPYPGTEEFIKRKENGVKLLTTDWEQYIFSKVVMETKNLKKDKLRKLYTKGVYKFLEVTTK